MLDVKSLNEFIQQNHTRITKFRLTHNNTLAKQNLFLFVFSFFPLGCRFAHSEQFLFLANLCFVLFFFLHDIFFYYIFSFTLKFCTIRRFLGDQHEGILMIELFLKEIQCVLFASMCVLL